MLFLTGAGGAPTSYQINRSLRFNDDDTAYLNRTPAGAGNRKTWTWSGWVKRSGTMNTDNVIFSYYNSGTNFGYLRFSDTNIIGFQEVQTSTIADLQTTALFRDPSGWYHIVLAVDTTQATAANRIKLYVNGTQITAFTTATYYNLNADTDFNRTYSHHIGRLTSASQHFDGYMAEIHFVDGTALTPSSFGETDAVTGVWKPKRVSGVTYGTNGFYLSFNDNTSTTTLGYDDAGSNDWTLNNFSVTAGVGNDSLQDTPTNNFCVLNGAQVNGGAYTLSNGNLDVVRATNSDVTTDGSVRVAGGKWYWETTVTAVGGTYAIVGVLSSVGYTAVALGTNADQYSYISSTGNKFNSGSSTAYGSTYTTNDVIGVALDSDAGKLYFSKNGTWQNSGDPAAGTGEAFSGLSGSVAPAVNLRNGSAYAFNFGQRPFAYTPPTGFQALCTRNLPTPAIAKPSQYFDATAYVGNGATQSIVNAGAFQPDLIWVKNRANAGADHIVVDAVRGVSNWISTNLTAAEASASFVTAINSNGFSVGAANVTNQNATNIIAWQWREGVTPGFDIVTYTGNGSNRTIAHSLGAAPHLMIVKERGGVNDWPVYHRNMDATPQNGLLYLNATNAYATASTVWNNTAPTASVFSLGTNGAVNNNTDTYVAYLFTEIAGFSRFGSYTGNGSADGVFVWTGFRPRLIGVKRTDTTGDWFIWDTARDSGNVAVAELLANSSAVEAGTADLDILSNGFKLRATTAGFNANTGTYIFFAFSETPFQYARAR